MYLLLLQLTLQSRRHHWSVFSSEVVWFTMSIQVIKTILWSYHWTLNGQCYVKPSFIFKYKENKYQFPVPRNVICKNILTELFMNYVVYRSQENVVNIVTVLQAGWFRVLFLAGARDISLLWNIQAGSGTHLALYSVGTGDSATEVGQPGAWC